VCNMNYAQTSSGVKSWSEITCAGTRTKNGRTPLFQAIG
jgi:hypothetical protein